MERSNKYCWSWGEGVVIHLGRSVCLYSWWTVLDSVLSMGPPWDSASAAVERKWPAMQKWERPQLWGKESNHKLHSRIPFSLRKETGGLRSGKCTATTLKPSGLTFIRLQSNLVAGISPGHHPRGFSFLDEQIHNCLHGVGWVLCPVLNCIFSNDSHNHLHVMDVKTEGEKGLLFTHLVVSDSLWPHGLQHARFPCPLLSISWSLLKFKSIESMMPSNHLILSSLPPPALNLSQVRGLFRWVGSSHQVAKVLELQLQHQSFQWIITFNFL